jgi:TPR repeat protein
MASDSGVTDASYRLGVIYEELKGNNQSFSEATRLYSEATKQDHEEAMYRLARIYHLGRGVEWDYQKAYDLYTKAAGLGHNESNRIFDITNYSIGQHSGDLNNSLSIIQYMAKKKRNIDLQYILGTFYLTKKKAIWITMKPSSGIRWLPQMIMRMRFTNSVCCMKMDKELHKTTARQIVYITRLKRRGTGNLFTA